MLYLIDHSKIYYSLLVFKFTNGDRRKHNSGACEMRVDHPVIILSTNGEHHVNH